MRALCRDDWKCGDESIAVEVAGKGVPHSTLEGVKPPYAVTASAKRPYPLCWVVRCSTGDRDSDSGKRKTYQPRSAHVFHMYQTVSQPCSFQGVGVGAVRVRNLRSGDTSMATLTGAGRKLRSHLTITGFSSKARS